MELEHLDLLHKHDFLWFPFLTQLLKEAVESQRMCELMKQQEIHLKQQVSHHRCNHSCFTVIRFTERGSVCAFLLVVTVHREV